MNKKTPPAGVAFLAATVVLALFVSVWAVAASGFPWREFPVFALLVVMGALAHLYPIRSAQTSQATYVVANTYLFAAVLLLSSGWLALLAWGVWLPLTVRRYRQRKPDWLLIPAANAGQSLVAVVAGHVLLAGWTRHMTPTLIDVGVLLLVISGFVVFQTAWVSIMLHLGRSVPLRNVALWNRDSLISDGVLLCLGAVLAVLWLINPALPVLLVAPVMFAYYMLRGVQLIRLGEIDGKTGLYNSRRLEEQFQREINSAQLLRRPLSAVFFDLDFLRDINNNHGHLAGDAVIIEIAKRIRENIRHGDFAARFGGEEFVLLLPGTEVIEAHWLAERIRKAVADVLFDIGEGKYIPCTISGGVATYPLHGQTVSELTAVADAALYHAKGQGRNRICCADDLPAQRPAAHPCPDAGPAAALATAAAAVMAPAEAPPATPAAAPDRAEDQKPPQPAALPAAEQPPVRPDRHFPGMEVGLTVLAMAAALVVTLPVLSGPVHVDPLLLGTLCVLGFAAEYWKVELLTNSRASVSLGVAATMAAGATMGVLAALTVNLVNFLAHLLQSRQRRPAVLLGNFATLILSAVAGSLPFMALGQRTGVLDVWRYVAVLIGGALYFGVNVGLVTLLLSRRQGTPVRQLWRRHYGWMAPSFIFTAASGALAGSAYLGLGWQALPLFVLPILIMRYSYQVNIQRSREAFEAAERGRKALEEAHDLQKRAMGHLIEAVSAIIDARDRSVSGHSWQVARYAAAIGERMGLSAEELVHLRQGALLHDLGKVGIPEVILQKPGKLTPEEWEIMKLHTRIGERILRPIPGLAETARIVGEHHEKYGGKGYPGGLSGQEISLGARIVALADALDTMLSDRPYSRAKPLAWAIEEIERCAGEHFDPQVVTAFRDVVARQSPEFFVNSAPVKYPYEPLTQAAAMQA